MPNWCECELRVVGARAELEELWDTLRHGLWPPEWRSHGLFDDAAEEVTPTGGGTRSDLAPSIHGTEPGEWLVEEWIIPHGEDLRIEDMHARIETWTMGYSRLMCWFLSANQPPCDLFLRVSKTWREPFFEIVWREGCSMHSGFWLARSGAVAADVRGWYEGFVEMPLESGSWPPQG